MIVQRIHNQLKKLDISPRKASMEAGLGPDAIRDLERRSDVIPRIDTIEALAEVLRISPEQLAFGRRRRQGAVSADRTAPIIGEVAAGLWLDVDADQREFEQYPVPIDPGYPAEAQYGLIVLGTSINRVAQPGDILQCVDVGIASITWAANDLVIVERRRAQGSQKEVTAKRVRDAGRLIELVADSDDKRWDTPLILDPRKAKDNEEIAVIAVVIGVYKPLRKKRP